MEVDIKALEIRLNDYFLKYDNDMIIANLEAMLPFINLIKNVKKNISTDFKALFSFSYHEIGILDSLEIVKKYYRERSINVDVDSLINKGIIACVPSSEYKYESDGRSYYENQERLIDIKSFETTYEMFLLIHELSHFQDQEVDGRNATSDFFTEGLAYAEEMIFGEYLATLGYNDDKKLNFATLMRIFYNNAIISEPIIKFLFLYQKLGSIDKDSYKLLYKDDDYERLLDRFINYVSNYDINIFNKCHLIFGAVIAIYLYGKYQEDNDFFRVITKMHEAINKQSILSCFRMIGLTGKVSDFDLLEKYLTKVINDFILENTNKRSR